MADTGLDLNHCHFREDDGDSIEPSDWDSPETDLTKRKVVQYIAYVDDFDGEGQGLARRRAFAGSLLVFDTRCE